MVQVSRQLCAVLNMLGQSSHNRVPLLLPATKKQRTSCAAHIRKHMFRTHHEHAWSRSQKSRRCGTIATHRASLDC
jgi:hypothetical protein